MSYRRHKYRSPVQEVDYHKLKLVADARKLSDSLNGCHVLADKDEHGEYVEVISAGIFSRYYSNGTIDVRRSHNNYTCDRERNVISSTALPPGVEWFGFSYPQKHYLKITKNNRVRYWVMPIIEGNNRYYNYQEKCWVTQSEKGLVLVPNDRLGYVPMSAIQDYRYTLDKKLLNHLTKEKYAKIFDKLEKLWPFLHGTTRQFSPFNITNEDTWFSCFDYWKGSGETKQIVKEKIRAALIRREVPCVAEKVSPQTYHHNKYWHYENK